MDMNKPQQLIESVPDVAPLAWLSGEIRTATEAAVAGLREFLGTKSNVEALRGARAQVHLANGALRMLDLRGAALLLESIEQLLKHWEAAPVDCVPGSVQTIEGALEAVVAYLEGLRAGRADQPIRLFSHYRDILQLAGASRVHPADLMFPDLTRRPAFHAIGVRPLTADQLRVRRARFEGALLGFLRDPSDHTARRDMRDSLSDLEKLPQRGLARSFWWVVRGLLDALEADALAVDVDLKRVLARVNLQLRRLIEGGGAVAERLLVDALYYIGRADPRVARVAEARRLYDLDALLPADFERSKLTLLDADQMRSLRESLAEAKSAWSQAAGGGDAAPFAQHIAAARRAAASTAADPIDLLLAEVETTAAGFAAAPISARESLGIEVATALLLVDLGVDDLPNLDERFEGRARAMIERLRAASRGEAAPTVEHWLTELARKAQDRLTMQTVIAEMQGMLREIEQRLDRFFREPAERGDLGALDGMIEQMGSVLALLGFDDVVAALANARESVRRYVEPATPADEADFARLASNLGAVGFFVETLQHDAGHPRSHFRWDAAAAVFSADLAVARKDDAEEEDEDEYGLQAYAEEHGHAAENVETAARHHLEQARELASRLTATPGDTLAARQLQELTQRLVSDADLLDDAQLKSRARDAVTTVKQLLEKPDAALAQRLAQLLTAKPAEAPVAPIAAPLPATQDAADQELMAIFVEEADEVLAGIDEQLAALRSARGDAATLTTVRRAFHTLKGSSRMVGLAEFGEGAWAIEQCFNAWLSQERAATDDLIALAAAAQTMMSGWMRRIQADAAAAIDPQALVAAAQRVRDGQPFAIDAALLQPVSADAAIAPLAEVDIPEAFEPVQPTHDLLAGTAPAVGVAETVLELHEQAAAEAQAPVDQPAEAVVGKSAAAPPEVPADEPAVAEEAAEAVAEHEAIAAEGEEVRRIGPVVISHGLYSVFLSEADESVRALAQDVAEWRFEPDRAVSSNAMRRAHSLAGITATVGLDTVWALADPLDDLLHEMSRLEHATHAVFTGAQFDSLERVIERIRGMLHQFAAGIYPAAATSEVAAIRELVSYVRACRALASDHAATATPGAPAEAVTGHLPAIEAAAASETERSAELPVPEEGSAVAAAPAEDATLSAQPPAPDELPVIDVPPGLAALTPPSAAEAPREQAEAQAAPAVDQPVAAETEPSVAAVADEIDADLLPVFLAEANELLPTVGSQLRALADSPADRAPMRELMRLLHTVKGSARMSGAMRLGELVHDMETRIESAMAMPQLPGALVDDLLARYDQAMTLFDGLQRGESVDLPSLPVHEMTADLEHEPTEPTPLVALVPPAKAHDALGLRPTTAARAAPAPSVTVPAEAMHAATAETSAESASSFVRVRAEVLDKLVDQAGEVLIARSRVENHTTTLKSSLADLNENIHRLRTQMRELEIQAEAQIQARSEKLSRESAAFDPLEFDRFTRLQELTRMIAESIEDVATVQGAMLKGLQTTEGDLSAQYRLTRELQQQLMRVRLVPFSSISERLYRVARQAGKEVGKRVNVDIRGGRTELDRVVLERMAGPFEHMVRNAIVHGLEAPEARSAAGKPEVGELRIEVRQESNEIIIVIADDGAGLDLARIRARALSSGLLRADQQPSDRELMDLIFAAGFSTATEVTELAGRGVGLDVVRSELSAFGGRIAIASDAGRGTRFTLNLPLTLAVTQVVLATVAGRRYAIPAGMVEQVKRVRPEDVTEAIADGMLELPQVGEVALRTMAQLLGEDTTLHQGRQVPVVLLRSGDDRMAVVADEVSSNQEVVVKNVGAQVARLAGILGATILGNGEIVLIINPVQLIVRAPEPPRLLTTGAVPQQEAQQPVSTGEAGVTLASAPMIMVVDDSLTVRRVTQRLLERSGYEVLLAKDGVDALRQLQDMRPDVMLVDIEMPRMDGFDLTRNVRGADLTRSIPIIMITSRTADKHRRMAMELGVNAYLGKPYQEEELLALIRSYLQEKTLA
jgi:chemosensory pili system protein ChpA (sensor histidine kinase/response regulator)